MNRPIQSTLFVIATLALAHAEPPSNDRFSGHRELVAETHAASLKLREAALRQCIAKDTTWPPGTWGENLWTLAALSLNEKVDQANVRLLERANEYLAANRTSGSVASPTAEKPDGAPWTFFSITDYVRTLCLFHSRSPHHPGRLTPETEAAMKEALWLWTSMGSLMADTGPDDLFLLLGTENHDLNLRPVYHLVTALLKDDPSYKDRKLGDGHTTAEHAAAHAAFFREWPRRRAASGMWIEVGSNTYQKYSWPALFNLHELSPDPVVRHRFGLLLDLAFIEEAQISVQGRRGGGRSRAYGGPLNFESYKNLLYAVEGRPAVPGHSRVIETSSYQLPPEAILLAKRAFPARRPFVIRNRVLGQVEEGAGEGHRIAADSALVNLAYRSPHYLLGSTLQNPAYNYSGISRQNRAWGMLFEGSHEGRTSEIHPVIEKTSGGRPQHPFWSVQHGNALIHQRIAGHKQGGSYSTGKISIHFTGDDLQKIEEDGWIFVTNGKAHAGVRFLDGGHVWDEQKTEAAPARFTGPGDPSRILFQAGDIDSHGSFAKFRETLRAHPLEVSADKVDYRFFGGNRIEMHRYDPANPAAFTPPLINGKPVDLQPEAVYESPFLNGRFGSNRFAVTIGPLKRLIDFSAEGK